MQIVYREENRKMPRSRKVTERKAATGVKTRRRKTNSGASQEKRQAMIAEAAYFKAEQRNFTPGYEELDWLEAEKEIESRFENQ